MHGQNKNAATPAQYIAAIDEPRRSEIAKIHRFIRAALPAKGFAPHIMSGALAYGTLDCHYASGRVATWTRVGLASNKQYISLYICAVDSKQRYIAEKYRDKLPKASVGKSCVRFKRFDDLDPKHLRAMLKEAATGTFGT